MIARAERNENALSKFGSREVSGFMKKPRLSDIVSLEAAISFPAGG
jgi:hypothetical protein